VGILKGIEGWEKRKRGREAIPISEENVIASDSEAISVFPQYRLEIEIAAVVSLPRDDTTRLN
jgi:hypothetical protein